MVRKGQWLLWHFQRSANFFKHPLMEDKSNSNGILFMASLLMRPLPSPYHLSKHSSNDKFWKNNKPTGDNT